MNINIIEKFYSKRNNVYKIEVADLNDESAIAAHGNSDKYSELSISNTYVLKEYLDSKVLENEVQNISFLQKHNISIPKVLLKDSSSIILEYIPGETINALIERQHIGIWIDELALWMSQLHKITNDKGSVLKLDVNLRNFIYNNNMIFGLDFEDIGYGDPRKDLANICFFILTNKPSFTRKKHLMTSQFLHCYEYHSGIKLRKMGQFLRDSVKESKIRRKNNV